MQHQRVPNHDQQRTVLFRVPAPETSPTIIGPQSTQDGTNEAEQNPKAGCAITATVNIAKKLIVLADPSSNQVSDTKRAGNQGRHITKRHADHVSGQPKLCV